MKSTLFGSGGAAKWLSLSLLICSAGSLFAQATLYIFNNTFETDAQSTGGHPSGGSWQISDGGTSITGGISEFNYDGTASPQGGNYVYGPYQGAGNLMDEIYNFTATSGAGTAFADSSAAPFDSWVDGAEYEIVYWFRPIGVRNTVDDSVWAMTFNDELLFQQFSEDGSTTLNGTLNLPISTTDWTEIRVPITYDAAFWNNEAPLFFVSPQFTGWTQIGGPAGGFQPNLESPSATYSIAIDTGIAVPEVSTSVLSTVAGALALLRRRRRKGD